MLMISKKVCLPALAFCALIPASGYAQLDSAETLPEYEIDRNVVEMNDRIDRPEDYDIFDSAILFSSYDRDNRVVHCIAYDARGDLEVSTVSDRAGSTIRIPVALNR